MRSERQNALPGQHAELSHAIKLVDVAVIDPVFDRWGSEDVEHLIEQCFVEFDEQIQQTPLRLQHG